RTGRLRKLDVGLIRAERDHAATPRSTPPPPPSVRAQQAWPPWRRRRTSRRSGRGSDPADCRTSSEVRFTAADANSFAVRLGRSLSIREDGWATDPVSLADLLRLKYVALLMPRPSHGRDDRTCARYCARGSTPRWRRFFRARRRSRSCLR